MTERIAHRDLRNRSAEILRAVAEGASFEITNHGDVVALLVPAGPEPLSVRRATDRRRFADIESVRRAERTEDVLEELRGER